MCHFLTATLPSHSRVEALAGITSLLALRPLSNAHLAAQLRPGELQLGTCTGPCDCGTALGSAFVAEDEEEQWRRGVERERKKLQKKGWSAAKIARAEEQRAAAREQHPSASGPSPELAAWLALLREGIGGGLVAEIGILLHSYRGGLEGERIALKAVRTVALAQVDEQLLRGIEEDVLYRVAP